MAKVKTFGSSMHEVSKWNVGEGFLAKYLNTRIQSCILIA